MAPPEGGDRHFGTDAVRAELARRSASSGIYAIGGRVLQIFLRVGSVAVLARLLTPEDFGVRGLVLPVTILLHGVINLGLHIAALQRDDLDHEELSRLFWFSSWINLLLVGGMALLGPFLAAFYDDPRVTGVTIAWAAALYLMNVGAFHETLLKRQMRFGTLVSIHTVAMVIGVLVAIVAAALGAGYWALVYDIVAMSLVRAIGVWALCGWRPSRPRRLGSAERMGTASMLTYGKGLSGFRLVAWLGAQLDRVLVGLLGGAPVLGLYDNARRWAWLPYLELHQSLSDVAVASFSRVQREPAEYRRIVRGGLASILALVMPATAFLFVEAREVVLVLFGDQWLGAVPYMQLMAVAAFTGGLNRLNQWIYNSLGETGRQFRWSVFQTLVTVVALAIGALWGPIGVAIGFTAAVVLLTYPSVVYCLRTAPLKPADFFGAATRPATASFLAGAVTFIAARFALGGLGLAAAFAIEIALFGGVYVFSWILLPGGRAAAVEVKRALREAIGRGAAGTAEESTETQVVP
jgi:PST family polysaccharide transporter